ncbi:MAG: citrate/2-methylcitrate synthase [Pseudomonadota bacterium]
MKVRPDYVLFDRDTQAIIFNYQQRAIQRMLDFDYVCGRQTPSVGAIVNPTRGGFHKCFFGEKEILVPMVRTIAEAVNVCPNCDVMINFASFRSAYVTSLEALETKSIRTVVIIAEGLPERRVRQLIAVAARNKKVILGPATVGGIVAGAFKVGNTAGTVDNILACKLNRPGSVAYVSKSGGLSNELNNIISRNSDGVREGVAIGGDRYPGTSFIDHFLRYEKNPDIKMMVMLGEIGGRDEYAVVEAVKSGKITKPVVAWCIGTCSKVFPSEVQFGHAGARAGAAAETADAKNEALMAAGAVVPQSFDSFGEAIRQTYESLKASKAIVERTEEQAVPKIPAEYAAALAGGQIRRPTSFISTISDDRGEELTYAGVPISEVITGSYGLGDVIGLLWFKRRFPTWASSFVEMVLKIVADHGPCVSGAHNAIVTARAGKDVISSLCSGLLTIGPRFGGAIDGAAQQFKHFHDAGKTPGQMVSEMKVANANIPGIGHRIKSVQNPDMRVELLVKYAKGNFPKTQYLDYALEVEKITTSKRNNLLLNVDGCIGILFVDLMSSLGMNRDEIDDVIACGALNGLFVLGRSIGFMGHIIDQKRLKAGLYRHPWEDVLYLCEPAAR